MTTKSTKKAFTIPEIAVVFVLAAILIGAVAPKTENISVIPVAYSAQPSVAVIAPATPENKQPTVQVISVPDAKVLTEIPVDHGWYVRNFPKNSNRGQESVHDSTFGSSSPPLKTIR